MTGFHPSGDSNPLQESSNAQKRMPSKRKYPSGHKAQSRPSGSAGEHQSKLAKSAARLTLKPVDVIKSSEDQRQYRVIRLPNGLEAVLVADTETVDDHDDEDDNDDDDDESDSADESMSEDDQDGSEYDSEDSESSSSSAASRAGPKKPQPKRAAAALAVKIGNFSDPDSVQGLAHFLEHMLFLGTKTYPSENGWESFVSKHGGWSNASTDWEYTIFQFEVAPSQFREALERFSGFFYEPIMGQDGAEREMQAVDSEFQSAKTDDGARRNQILCHHAKPGHPYARFCWGNLESLQTKPKAAGVDIRAELLEFHRKYYTADAMRLAVHGSDLDELEEWVREMFASVPGKHAENSCSAPNFHEAGSPFDESTLGHVFKIVPVKDKHNLDLLFPLPPLDADYGTKPTEFLGMILGHEGQGSLFSLLKSKGWIDSLSAGSSESGDEMNSAFWLFSVQVSLTEEGIAHYLDVAALIFQFIQMIRDQPVQDWLFEENRRLAEMAFRFQQKADPVDYVEDLCLCLHSFPAAEVLSGGYLYTEFDKDLIVRIQNLLRPDNCVVQVSSKQFAEQANLTEPWFGAEYSVAPIPADLVREWSSPSSTHESFALPKPNPFIPTDFTILSKSLAPVEASAPPVLALSSDKMAVWHKTDHKFKTPRTNAYFLLESPHGYHSPAAVAYSYLAALLIKDTLQEFVYPADLAGLSYSVDIVRRGMEVKIKGYSHKLFVLAKQIFETVADIPVDADRFAVLKEKLVRYYKNVYYDAGKQASYTRLLMTQDTKWPVEDLLSEARNVNVETLSHFMKQMREKMFLEALIHGNVSQDQTVEFAQWLEKKLDWRPIPASQLHAERVVRLESSQLGAPLVQCTSRNPEGENSAVETYLQIGADCVRLRTLCMLAETILWEPCFDQLRTKEQLGYDVSLAMKNTNQVLGFVFKIVSAKFDPLHLAQRIEAYLGNTLREMLQTLSDDDFNDQIQSMITERQFPENNLREETSRLWAEIGDHTYVWDRYAQEVAVLQSLTKQDLVEFCVQFLMPVSLDGKASPCERMIIQVFGKSNAIPTEDFVLRHSDSSEPYALRRVGCVFAWKRCQSLWPDMEGGYQKEQPKSDTNNTAS